MILIYSKDAGGAEILSSWLKEKKIKNIDFILKGPAINIFKSKSFRINNIKNKIQVSKYKKFFFSTNFPPGDEIKLLKRFKKKNVETVCFLDHWVNYKERFTLQNKTILPDKIYTFDNTAFKIAKQKFNKSNIFLKKNYYLFEQKKYINNLKKNKKHILLLSSPAYNSMKKYSKKMTDKKNMEKIQIFIKKIILLKKNFNSNLIVIRPHPSELKKNFKLLSKKIRGFSIKISNNSLIEDIADSEAIFGTNSMAFLTASLMKKKIYNILFGKKNTIPIKNIINI